MKFAHCLLMVFVIRKYAYIFRGTPRTSVETSLSYEICSLFTCRVCYWEVCIHFLVRGVEYSDGGFSAGRIFHSYWKFQRCEFSGEIFYWGNLPEFLYKILFSVLFSLSRLNLACGDVNCNCPGQSFTTIELSRGSFRGGEPDFLTWLKKPIRN